MPAEGSRDGDGARPSPIVESLDGEFAHGGIEQGQRLLGHAHLLRHGPLGEALRFPQLGDSERQAGREIFLVYGTVYAALGVCAAVLPHIHRTTPSMSFVLAVVSVAAAALWWLRRRLQEPDA